MPEARAPIQEKKGIGREMLGDKKFGAFLKKRQEYTGDPDFLIGLPEEERNEQLDREYVMFAAKDKAAEMVVKFFKNVVEADLAGTGIKLSADDYKPVEAVVEQYAVEERGEKLTEIIQELQALSDSEKAVKEREKVLNELLKSPEAAKEIDPFFLADKKTALERAQNAPRRFKFFNSKERSVALGELYGGYGVREWEVDGELAKVEDAIASIEQYHQSRAQIDATRARLFGSFGEDLFKKIKEAAVRRLKELVDAKKYMEAQAARAKLEGARDYSEKGYLEEADEIDELGEEAIAQGVDTEIETNLNKFANSSSSEQLSKVEREVRSFYEKNKALRHRIREMLTAKISDPSVAWEKRFYLQEVMSRLTKTR